MTGSKEIYSRGTKEGGVKDKNRDTGWNFIYKVIRSSKFLNSPINSQRTAPRLEVEGGLFSEKCEIDIAKSGTPDSRGHGAWPKTEE